MFPTCVGMNRPVRYGREGEMSVPHMRGDEPVNEVGTHRGVTCSPHAWG